MRVKTPSINAVPDEAVIYIDRRLTLGETKADAVAQVEALIPEESKGKVWVEVLRYEEPSYTGFVLPVEKYFPAWLLEDDHPIVQAGQRVRRLLGWPDAPTGKWDFSTNGTYWAGVAGIPTIGFGPGDEIYAHTVLDQVPLEDVVLAAAFYALFPAVYRP